MNLTNTYGIQPSFGITNPFREEADGLAKNAASTYSFKNSGYGKEGDLFSSNKMRSTPNVTWDDPYGTSVIKPGMQAASGGASSDPNFLQKLMGGDEGAYNTVQAGLGIGQLGLGLASYLQQRGMAKKQGKLLDQQISNNKFEMDNRRKMVEAFNDR